MLSRWHFARRGVVERSAIQGDTADLTGTTRHASYRNLSLIELLKEHIQDICIALVATICPKTRALTTGQATGKYMLPSWGAKGRERVGEESEDKQSPGDPLANPNIPVHNIPARHV